MMNTDKVLTPESKLQSLIDTATNKLHSGKLDEAEAIYRQVLDIKAQHSAEDLTNLQPNLVEAYRNLGIILELQGKLDEAINFYQQAINLQPDFVEAKFRMLIAQLPIIYSNYAEIELRRDNYRQQLQDLAHFYQTADRSQRAKAADSVGLSQPYLLAYQGLNDRDLQQTYGTMISQLMASRYPQWSKSLTIPQLKTGEKIRVGFVSGYFWKHSVWKIPIKGWVENLDRSEFELFGYHTGTRKDSETVRAAKAFDKFIYEPLSVQQWCEKIAQDNLHILIFPEFGMDPMTVKLGSLRLAPMQVVFGGHPETSGLPTIDYHLTSDLMEPANGQEHYSEQLVRLPNLAVNYELLAVQPQAMSKSELGIADDEIMFWCCQYTSKYLPQHDDVFPRIAQELDKAKFVFINNRSEYITEIFRQRLSSAFEQYNLDYRDFCIFVARMNDRAFAGTTAIADIFLDSIGWSGNNTTMESTSYNLPIVTCPTDLMRGRHAMAILKMMGIEETIAASKEEYIEIAVRLGKDRAYRQQISQKIAQNKQKLYGDLEPIIALEDFLLQTVGKQPRKNQSKSERILQSNLRSIMNRAIEQQKLGKFSQAQSLFSEAQSLCEQLLKIQPNAEVYKNLGQIFGQQDKLERAIAAYQQALNLEPDAEVYFNLGITLQDQGKLDQAIAAYQQALTLEPNCASAQWMLLIAQLPIISSSVEEIHLKRERYRQHLHNLAAHYQQANSQERAEAARVVGLQPFYLAYQGLNDRDLQQTYGTMISQLMTSRYPQWSKPLTIPQLKAEEKIRVGFVSGYFCKHSVWKIPIKGWVENLDRREFELFGYHTGTRKDSETVRAAKAFDKFIHEPLSVQQWCEKIAEDNLHVLIFPEFGMDPMTVQLGCLRLAPIQMTSWGHPITSGLPTIDYYLGSDLMEPSKGQEHYSEQLVRLPNLAVNYELLAVRPQTISKAEIDIAEDEIMFWCCQNLSKYLPQHDDVFPRIARELGRAKFVFINNRSEYVTEIFRQRLSSAFEQYNLDYRDFCIFLSRMNDRAFAGTIAIADVFLDSIGWSGCNSSMETIVYDLPLVTLPGEFMRGRHTMAILKMMGIEETIAASKEEYIKIAVRLGQDAEYRQHISQKIAQNKHKLYGDLEPIIALEDFLLQTVGKQPRKNQSKSERILQSNLRSIMNRATEQQKLGKFSQARSLFSEAQSLCEQLLTIQPNAEVYKNLGQIFEQQDKLERAISAYQQALNLEPDAQVYLNLGIALEDQGKLNEAIESYQQALNLEPDNVTAKWGLLTAQLPIISSSVEEIHLKRERYRQHLHNLAAHYQQANSQERAEAARVVGYFQPFFLAYQGLNDRDLQQTYGEMISQLMASRYPQYSQPLHLRKLPAQQKIRIGFVSHFFYAHSVWKIPLKGWVENLDRSEFELFGYYTGTIGDRETVRAAKAFDKFIHESLSVEQWCEKIAQDNLDILIFPEFGMDPMTLKLGCLRLAPVQVVFGGHPETSGLPTIDYHLTSDLMEPPDGQEHYTEKLVRLPNLAVNYELLAVRPQANCKADIGIAEDEIMFWCCQSTYKYLPQHDDVFPQIAREVAQCKFVFLEAPQGAYITEVFRQRLNLAFEKLDLNYQDYCLFLPRMDAETFAGTAAIADVFLDNIGWSGNNSTMESTAYNLPIVTYPTDLMRGRHTMAILKMMGIEETIAASKEEYIKIAVRLGQDAEYRQQISQKIAQNKHKLYGDLAPVRALEDFLLKVVNKPRSSNTAQVVENFQLAQQYHRANRLAQAKQEYQKVLTIQPDHAEALYGLGILTQQEGNLKQAEQLLERAVEVQPHFLKAWFSLGNLCQSQSKFPAAEQAYQQAIALRPDAAPLYNNLGYALQEQGKWSQAIACYQKALELQPNCTEADVNWGNALFAQGQLSPEKQVRYAELNYQLGLARHRVKDYQTAAIYYQQAIAMQPDLEAARYYLELALQEEENLTIDAELESELTQRKNK